MAEIQWSRPAINDLQLAGDYIAAENAAAAKRMAIRVQEAVEYLVGHPSMGRSGRLEGTRELVVSGTPFVLVYWVRDGVVQILRVLHHAQRWPDGE